MAQKVLVADDQIASRRMFEMVLSREGYDVITVDSGAKALDIVREKRPDIALIDAVMPELDGYQVCETLRNSPNFENLPLILLAGTYEGFDKERGLEVVGTEAAILNKPAKSYDILAKVQELLAASEAEVPEVASTEATPIPETEVVQEPPIVKEGYEFDEDSEEADLVVESEILDEGAEFEEMGEEFAMEIEEAEPLEEQIEDELFSLEESREEPPPALETTPVVEETPPPEISASKVSPEVSAPPTSPATQFSDEKLDMIADEIAQRLAGRLVPVLAQELANYFMQFPPVKNIVEHTSKQLVKELLPEMQDKL